MGSTTLIRYLNDRFRSTFQGGKVVLTRGIRALPQEEITELLSKVSNFNDFIGKFKYHNKQILWKVDYYDTDYVYASEDPADIMKTKRLLTILTTDEY